MNLVLTTRSSGYVQVLAPKQNAGESNRFRVYRVSFSLILIISSQRFRVLFFLYPRLLFVRETKESNIRGPLPSIHIHLTLAGDPATVSLRQLSTNPLNPKRTTTIHTGMCVCVCVCVCKKESRTESSQRIPPLMMTTETQRRNQTNKTTKRKKTEESCQ